MEAESVAFFSRGEAMGEDAREVGRLDAHAVVDDADADKIGIIARLEVNAYFKFSIIPGCHRVFGVAQEVDEDLQDGVLVGEEFGDIGQTPRDWQSACRRT